MQTVYIVHSLYSVKSSFFQSSPFIASQLLLLWTTSVVTKYPFNPRKDINFFLTLNLNNVANYLVT